MKAIIFDSGTLISFSMNGLLDELRGLRKIFRGKFLITKDVKREVIDKPLTIKKFELEALRIKQLLDEKVLEMPEAVGVFENEISKRTEDFLNIANNMFISKKENIHLIDSGEASCLALSKILNDKKIENVIAVDERTTRMLGENPEGLSKIMTAKLHTKIIVKKENFIFFKDFKFIRSTELIYVAYKKGIMNIKDGNLVLDALLYALKIRGAAISDEEIREIKSMK